MALTGLCILSTEPFNWALIFYIFYKEEVARHDRPHRCETFEKLHIFALTSMSFKDFPFLKDMIGGSLKISSSSGCSSIMCHFFIRTCLMSGTAGSYCVTKGKISFVFFFVLFKR